MIKLDTRRLTGINVIWKHSGAVVDVRLNAKESADAVISSWNTHSRKLLDALGWQDEQTVGYHMHSGVALAISAPMDALYSAVEAADWLYAQVNDETAIDCEDESPNPEEEPAAPRTDFVTEVARLKNVILEESDLSLRSMLEQAQQHNTTVLCDDDEVSIGLGRYSTTWNIGQIPTDVDYNNAKDIPVGLVTGTNGKTTTVRLTQRMLRAANLAVGISSTDWIGIDDTIIDRGDYSGPGGARAILRQPIDAAVLETARGGLLRRGLGMPRADVALITNIAEDHLGDFGSENLQELLNLKWIVTQALDSDSIAVLNAQDKMLVDKSAELETPVCWFSIDPEHAVIKRHMTRQLPVVTVIDNHFSRFDGKQWHTYCHVSEAPLTVDGSAKHNIANALGAIALAHYLGANETAINHGLTTMQPNDNPGRCNFFTIDGIDVLLDFAHNPSAMQAIFDIAAHHKTNNRFLCFGQAGDRTDNSIRELARSAWDIGLKHVFISELAEHRRGREANEVFNLLSEGLIAGGAERADISHYDVEQESLEHAIAMAKPGDLVIILALAESRSILKWLADNS